MKPYVHYVHLWRSFETYVRVLINFDSSSLWLAVCSYNTPTITPIVILNLALLIYVTMIEVMYGKYVHPRTLVFLMSLLHACFTRSQLLSSNVIVNLTLKIYTNHCLHQMTISFLTPSCFGRVYLFCRDIFVTDKYTVFKKWFLFVKQTMKRKRYVTTVLPHSVILPHFLTIPPT